MSTLLLPAALSSALLHLYSFPLLFFASPNLRSHLRFLPPLHSAAPVATAIHESDLISSDLKMEIEPPTPGRYLMGVAIMMAGVVLPLSYMMFRSKRSPAAAASSSSSSSSFAKQTNKSLIV